MNPDQPFMTTEIETRLLESIKAFSSSKITSPTFAEMEHTLLLQKIRRAKRGHRIWPCRPRSHNAPGTTAAKASKEVSQND
jgi:hypothetical protein